MLVAGLRVSKAATGKKERPPQVVEEGFVVPKLVGQCTQSLFRTAVGEELPQAILAVIAMVVFQQYSGFPSTARIPPVNLVISGGNRCGLHLERVHLGVLTSWSKAEKFSALDQEVRTSKRMMLQMLDGMGLDWEVIWIWLVVVLSTDVLGYSLLIWRNRRLQAPRGQKFRAVHSAIMKRQDDLSHLDNHERRDEKGHPGAS